MYNEVNPFSFQFNGVDYYDGNEDEIDTYLSAIVPCSCQIPQDDDLVDEKDR